MRHRHRPRRPRAGRRVGDQSNEQRRRVLRCRQRRRCRRAGPAPQGDLRALRYVTDRPYRLVEIADPPRDRAPARYRSAVETWHARRADIYACSIRDELGTNESGAFLVWGDPSLYDSTLRIIDQVQAGGTVAFEYEVIPGVTSISTLAAKHRLPLNGIGEGILITTGRRLAEDWARGVDNVVVMLDGGCAFMQLDPTGVEIYWGAYLGTPDEITLAGRLSDVGALIQQARERTRSKKGWIMDTYLLRRLPVREPD